MEYYSAVKGNKSRPLQVNVGTGKDHKGGNSEPEIKNCLFHLRLLAPNHQWEIISWHNCRNRERKKGSLLGSGSNRERNIRVQVI